MGVHIIGMRMYVVAIEVCVRRWIGRHRTGRVRGILRRVMLWVCRGCNIHRPLQRTRILVRVTSWRSWGSRGAATARKIGIRLESAISWSNRSGVTGMRMLLNIAMRVWQIPAVMRHIMIWRRRRGLLLRVRVRGGCRQDDGRTV